MTPQERAAVERAVALMDAMIDGAAQFVVGRSEQERFAEAHRESAKVLRHMLAAEPEPESGPQAPTMANGRPRYFPWTRQLTGKPHIFHAYVYDDNRVIAYCGHDHKGDRAARKCANEMYQAVLAGTLPPEFSVPATPGHEIAMQPAEAKR